MCQNHRTDAPALNRRTWKRDMSLRVWDRATGKEVRLVANEMMDRGISSPDGRLYWPRG